MGPPLRILSPSSDGKASSDPHPTRRHGDDDATARAQHYSRGGDATQHQSGHRSVAPQKSTNAIRGTTSSWLKENWVPVIFQQKYFSIFHRFLDAKISFLLSFWKIFEILMFLILTKIFSIIIKWSSNTTLSNHVTCFRPRGQWEGSVTCCGLGPTGGTRTSRGLGQGSEDPLLARHWRDDQLWEIQPSHLEREAAHGRHNTSRFIKGWYVEGRRRREPAGKWRSLQLEYCFSRFEDNLSDFLRLWARSWLLWSCTHKLQIPHWGNLMTCWLGCIRKFCWFQYAASCCWGWISLL